MNFIFEYKRIFYLMYTEIEDGLLKQMIDGRVFRLFSPEEPTLTEQGARRRGMLTSRNQY